MPCHQKCFKQIFPFGKFRRESHINNQAVAVEWTHLVPKRCSTKGRLMTPPKYIKAHNLAASLKRYATSYLISTSLSAEITSLSCQMQPCISHQAHHALHITARHRSGKRLIPDNFYAIASNAKEEGGREDPEAQNQQLVRPSGRLTCQEYQAFCHVETDLP